MVEAPVGQTVRGHELEHCCLNYVIVFSSVVPVVMLKWRSVQAARAPHFLMRDALQVVELMREVVVVAPRESPDLRCRGHAECGIQLASAQG